MGTKINLSFYVILRLRQFFPPFNVNNLMDFAVTFLGTQTTWIELFAVACGLLSVWFMKKENILVFPFGIVNVLVYVYICFTAGLYAYAGINIFYAVMSIYGWYNWVRKGAEDESLKISRLSRPQIFLYSALIAIFFVILRAVLVSVTDSVVPTWDALTTAIYIIGMWLLARKKIENWILWITGDVISVGLFAYEDLYFSSFQFLVFTIIAVFGFLEWRKKLLTIRAA
jgi:nicotinamide mononucleotide transporter